MLEIEWLSGPFIRIGNRHKLNLQVHYRMKDKRIKCSYVSVHFGTMKRGLYICFYRHCLEQGMHKNNYYKRLATLQWA